VINPLTPTVAT